MSKKQKVFVGMSGGVDSSVAALRLKQQGYEVVGVFIKVWHPDFMVCNWEQERLDAMRVAAHLEIPFLTCDAEAAYKNEVADYFINEYKAGRTPNPDVMCNREVKFGAFIEFAKAHQADFIATGHYAQRIDTDGVPAMHRGVDVGKDQTYFLWTLSNEQLAYSLFPVGDTPKDEIRKEALAAGIPVAEKQDSQGICFLGHVDIPEFLAHYTEMQTGDVLNEAGTVVGQHKGALVYTLGQRHGFTLHTSSNTQVPHFVIGKDMSANTITVAPEKPVLHSTENIQLHSLVLRSTVTEAESLQAQFRYRQQPYTIQLTNIKNDTATVTVAEEIETPSSGQSCVIYRGSHCLGGGMIV